MPSDASELASIIASVEELVGRVTAMAEHYGADDTDDTLSALHEAERALAGAVRRLTVAQRAVRGR